MSGKRKKLEAYYNPELGAKSYVLEKERGSMFLMMRL